MPEGSKRQNGRYYTEGNPFHLPAFKQWAAEIGLQHKKVLEPFAGGNNIIRALQSEGYAERFVSYDIDPRNPEVKSRDTLKNFPRNFDVCITNPPWLAKNSAHRRGLEYPDTQYDDLYKHALDLCLRHCMYVGALIPATFLQSDLFTRRLSSVVFLHDEGMFADTENPVCLALFKEESHDVKIYYDKKWVGNLSTLRTKLPRRSKRRNVVFNDPDGKLGFIAFDNTREPSIRFCEGRELNAYTVGHSSRMITRIGGDLPNVKSLIYKLNDELKSFRKETNDVFLTPFKGLRQDGMYRRRMDYSLARDFIATHA